jgi:hypothetical protein
MTNIDYYLPLSVSLTPLEVRHHYEINDQLPAHNLVIRVLIEHCTGAYLYGLKKDNELFIQNSDILQSDKGKYRFDTTKECITGHEVLWNVTGWKRGSIVIILENGKIDFKTLFKHCFRPGLSATPNMGNSISATKKCKKEASRNNIGICFPASNGLEWMQIYASPALTRELLSEARIYCQEKDYYSKKQ